MHRLSATLIAAVLAVALTQIASAADLPREAPPAPLPPPPVYTWTGFYIGGNVGYGWADPRTDLSGSGIAVDIIGFPSSFGFADSNRTRLDGVIGGGQIGYNYQFSPKWVVGIEADIQGTGQRGSNTSVDPFSTPICEGVQFNPPPPQCVLVGSLNGTAVTNYEARIKWFGTVRGRLGYLITDQLLLYGTGGLAYGGVEVSGNTQVSAPVARPPGAPFILAAGSGAFNASKTGIGFSVGAGLEGRVWLPANWTWKLEYLYLDLGSLDALNALSLGDGVPTPLTMTIRTHTHFTDNIVRVGLNYQFH